MKQVRNKRGVVLTTFGQQRLLQAIQNSQNHHNYGTRYTIEALSAHTNLDPATVSRVLGAETGVDKRTLQRFFQAFDLILDSSDYIKPQTYSSYQYWGEAPQISISGRTQELHQLQEWVIKSYIRLVALTGIGGVGKTALSVKISQILAPQFDIVIWQSLRNAPSLMELLNSVVQFLSNGEESDLPKDINYRINRLFEYLRTKRCLIILDNLEAIFQSGDYAGKYLLGYENYGELFSQIGNSHHQSCLIITSRQKPREVTILEEYQLPVRSLIIQGLDIAEIKDIFHTKGIFTGSDSHWQHLINHFAGNPLHLKIVASTILNLFDGDISKYIQQNISIHGDVKNIIEQEFNQLSEFEQSVIYWLAIYRTPVDIKQLKSDIILVDASKLLDTIESLHRRALIEKNTGLFTLQPVVMEYATSLYIDIVCQEILQDNTSLLRSHAIIQATAPDYILQVQTRLILIPILEGLSLRIGHPDQIQNQLIQILDKYRNVAPSVSGYLAGNIINLLGQLKPVVKDLDFSRLTIWQANLTNLILHNINFENSNFAKSTFTENIGIIFGLAFSPDDELLAMGSIDGDISIWNWQDNHSSLHFLAHSNIVECVTFSNKGKLASSSRDGKIKVWDTATGQLLIQTSTENGSPHVKNLQFSQDGCFLVGACKQYIYVWDVDTGSIHRIIETNSSVSALFVSHQIISGASDGIVNIWDLHTGKCITVNIDGAVRAVTCTNDDRILAVTVKSTVVQVWDVKSRSLIHSFTEHSYRVSSVAISNDGRILACLTGEKTIKLWDITTLQYHQTLEGHLSEINTLAFSTSGKRLVTGSVDRSVRLWDENNGKCIKIWQGRTDFVHSVAFTQDNKVIVSGSKHAIRFWDVNTGELVSTWYEYQDWLSSVVSSQNGEWLGCANVGGDNNTIRLWRHWSKAETLPAPNKILYGHTDSIWSIAFSPNGKIIASGSSDRSVKIWDCETGLCVNTFIGHTRPVLSVAFSTDGKTIASCGGHSVIKIWDVVTGECIQSLNERACYKILFSPDSKTLACCSTTGIIKLWNFRQSEYIQLGEYGHAVISSAFSPDGKILACGSKDGIVRLWDISTASCISFSTNIGSIWSLAFSSDGLILAIGADAQTIQLWNVCMGKEIQTLKAPRPYEGVKIKGVTGLTATKIENLMQLGAA
jgi:WD40 repeat protein